jgi:hypothetical protein
MAEVFVNKVAESGLITLNLEEWYPKEEVAVFDLKDLLFMGMIVKEKEFRESLKNFDWEQFRNKYVSVICSADAIIPVWAYMLVASYLQPVCLDLVIGDETELRKQLFLKKLNTIKAEDYVDQRVIVKGCGDLPIGEFAYLEITKLLRPHVKTLMYGEPCSTVPVYKKPK